MLKLTKSVDEVDITRLSLAETSNHKRRSSMIDKVIHLVW